MKFRRRLNSTQSSVTVTVRPPVSDEGRRAELSLGLNILADVTWKLVLSLSMLEENKDLFDSEPALANLKQLVQALTTEVDLLLSPLESGED
jgi:hypothetical protein